MDNGFLSRLKKASGERDITPWLKSLGFSGGLISSMLKGEQAAGGDLLRALQRTERLNLLWLEEGRGTPYSLYRVLDDDEAIALAQKLLSSDYDWSLVLATHNYADFVILLHHPDTYEYKDKPIDFRVVEVIGGRVSLKAVRWFESEKRAHWVLPLAADEFQQLNDGHTGNMAIFGWEDPRKKSDGLVRRLRHINQADNLAGALGRYEASLKPPELKAGKEKELIGHFRHLAEDDQATLLRVAQALDSTE